MMGGILVATVLTILVLPAAYALFFGRDPKAKGEGRADAAQNPGNENRSVPAAAAE